MKIFTSESVTEGHPDKVCDQISDAVLDALLEQDPMARVACESIVTTGMALCMGEISTEEGYVDIPKIVRETIRDIGYNDPTHGFDARSCAVLTTIDEQSPDIAMGVNQAYERQTGIGDETTGAGDQGMMFGFACDETPAYMPAAIFYAHILAKKLTAVRKEGTLPYLLPDGKSQVSVQYNDNGAVERIAAVVLSSQHDADVGIEQLRADLKKHVIEAALPAALLDAETQILINPTGRFVLGGPMADSGLTGRKIIVDTYGGYARHGGGCFSGKDPTKVDRAAAYMARYAAKNLVAAGLCKRAEIEVAYAIGVARPVSLCVDTSGTGTVSDQRLAEMVAKVFDFRPAKIIEVLDLRRPIYKQTAAYGHFGRDDLDLSWEKLDKVDALKAL